MRHDKKEIFELRKQGKSYRKISEITGISKSTLCGWFKNQDWSRHIKSRNEKVVFNPEHMRKMQERRRILLNEKYLNIENEADLEFERYKNDPLFIASLMLYLGEGDKSLNNSSIRIGNVDPNVLIIFCRFIVEFLAKNKSEIRFWLLGYPDLDIKLSESWWAEKLGFGQKNFYKTQIIQGRNKTKKLRYGVGNIIIQGKLKKVKLLRWIFLMSEYLTRV